MTREEFDAYCGTLPSVSHVIQWGGASVWKVGGKIFAICAHWGAGDQQKIGFKCNDLSYRILIEQPGIVPAPYLARAKWVQLVNESAMTDDEVRSYIGDAHQIIAGKLTRALRKQLGL